MLRWMQFARRQSGVQMKRLTTFLVLTIATITGWGQTKEQNENEYQLEFVFDSKNQEKIRTANKINRDLNAFYLTGDFDGDKNFQSLWLVL